MKETLKYLTAEDEELKTLLQHGDCKKSLTDGMSMKGHNLLESTVLRLFPELEYRLLLIYFD